ncbi:MAG: peptidylprolyl isomerase [Phycisphaerales bacterium]|nr:peptidylprolyl isomerase [Phycisphaerales bacterium]
MSQISPDRTYYGIDRPFPVRVANPAGNEDALSIRLLDASNVELERVDSVEPGQVDLAVLFPSLWETKGSRGVLYAQMYAGDVATGPAIVLQPMISQSYAVLDQRTGNLSWTPNPRTFTGYRAYIEKDVLMTTSEGDILFRMRPDHAPNTAWNFMQLGAGGFYTDIIFHRIVTKPNRFVIQAGDPLGEGSGGPGYMIDLEDSKLPHDFGVISMARSGDPNSNGSQIFVCLSREATRALDGRYTAFGQAISGADVINKLADTPLNGDRPVNPPSIKSVKLVDAAPRGTGVAPVKAPSSQSAGGR